MILPDENGGTPGFCPLPPRSSASFFVLEHSMKTCFILNPVAGSGRSKPALSAARAVFDAAGKPYEVWESLGPGHAVELAKNAAQGALSLSFPSAETARSAKSPRG